MKPALLIIDIQNEFLQYVPQRDKKTALEWINGAIWLFRQHRKPIIRVYHTEPGWGPEPGSEAFEFPKSVKIVDEDPMIVKNHSNAFKNTNLKKTLRDRECDTLFLCGFSATSCVLATYHGAKDRDLNVFMVRDALMSHTDRHTRFIEEIHDGVNFSTLRFMLEEMKD